MVDRLTPLHDTEPVVARGALRPGGHGARDAWPVVAALDPADPDYTAGDVDEALRWQRRTRRPDERDARSS